MHSPKILKTHSGQYTIAQYSQKPAPLEQRPSVFKFSNVVSWSLWLLYIISQFSFAWSVQKATSRFVWRMWVVLLAEVCLSIQEVVLAINIILALFGANDNRIRPCYRLIGNSAPTIDVFITCCGEPLDVVVDTLAAVVAQDYDPQRFRVFVLDDGHDEKLRMVVEAVGKKSAKNRGPQIRYLSRRLKPGVKSYFKAGNHQFGIDESERLGGSEFLASLDADMIPEPDWLRIMVPHLILDDKLGLACPPQHYYNVPEGDPLGQQAEFDMLFTVYEPLNDRLDAAMCTGSGFVVRRSALNDLGGWPLVEAGEDVMTSALLSNAGWKVAFIREDLQFGLAPGSLRAHVKQRMRWADAGIEVHKQFGFYIPGCSKIQVNLTFVQTAVWIIQALREYAAVTNVVALLLLPIALFPVQGDEFAMIAFGYKRSWLRIIFLATFLAHKINDYISFGHVGLRRLANFQSLDIWCAPFTATRCILSILPSAINTLTFEVTGSMISPANERSRLHRKPLPQRLFSLDLLMYFLYIIYASVPLLLRVLVYLHLGSPRSARFFPFPGAVIKLLECIWKAAVPLRYMLFPPTVPERGELVEMDEKGVRRPRKSKVRAAGDVYGVGWSWMDVCKMSVIWWCDWR